MAEQAAVGDVTGVGIAGGVATILAAPARARVTFLTEDVLRIEVALDGTFSEPSGGDPLPPDLPPVDMLAGTSFPGLTPELTDAGDHYLLVAGPLELVVHISPLRFALRQRAVGAAPPTPIFEESRPLAWDEAAGATTQRLTRRADEQFFGGGMQNGRFSHRHKAIEITVSSNWDDGGCPNSVPFYLSSAGYGVFRHTFAPGTYRFTDPVRTSHRERRYDAFIFVGPPKRVIDRYTELTGRPFLPPIYGLEPGDADCYLHNANRDERRTLDALGVADGYVTHGMPLGWMLVNDGYGCGYENLGGVAAGLAERNVTLGLWTSSGLADHDAEVAIGARVRKLDIAWVWPGFRFAAAAAAAAHRGIEDHCEARGFVWSPEGWTGSQRWNVAWSGDQEGSFEYIRWQIPTYAGATLSGLAATTGDVDGIYGGSPATYTRDLQWKTFLPVVMTMSGWAPTDKQPWRHGEPYTSVNRRYLLLRERLLPYLYTYCALAHRCGVGPVRPLVLEYPDDPATLREEARYQFLCGEAFLVAPVFQEEEVRDGIYLPAGTWTDYWSGERHRGPRRLHGYPAPLDRLPLFVRDGSVVPMWPEGTRSWATRDTTQIDLDVYPDADGGEGAFTLYEDDGVTRGYTRGECSEQTFTVTGGGPGRAVGLTVVIGAVRGRFRGQATSRRYRLSVHDGAPPGAVTIAPGGGALARRPSRADLDRSPSGWWHDPGRGGITVVRTPPVPREEPLTVVLHPPAHSSGGP